MESPLKTLLLYSIRRLVFTIAIVPWNSLWWCTSKQLIYTVDQYFCEHTSNST